MKTALDLRPNSSAEGECAVSDCFKMTCVLHLRGATQRLCNLLFSQLTSVHQVDDGLSQHSFHRELTQVPDSVRSNARIIAQMVLDSSLHQPGSLNADIAPSFRQGQFIHAMANALPDSAAALQGDIFSNGVEIGPHNPSTQHFHPSHDGILSFRLDAPLTQPVIWDSTKCPQHLWNRTGGWCNYTRPPGETLVTIGQTVTIGFFFAWSSMTGRIGAPGGERNVRCGNHLGKSDRYAIHHAPQDWGASMGRSAQTVWASVL